MVCLILKNSLEGFVAHFFFILATEAEENWSADERIFFADFTL